MKQLVVLFVAIAVASAHRQTCNPGAYYKTDCNVCVCARDGSAYICSRQKCSPGILNPDGSAKSDFDIIQQLIPDATEMVFTPAKEVSHVVVPGGNQHQPVYGYQPIPPQGHQQAVSHGQQQKPTYGHQQGHQQQKPTYGQVPQQGHQQVPSYGQQQKPSYGQVPPQGHQQVPSYGQQQQKPSYGQVPSQGHQQQKPSYGQVPPQGHQQVPTQGHQQQKPSYGQVPTQGHQQVKPQGPSNGNQGYQGGYVEQKYVQVCVPNSFFYKGCDYCQCSNLGTQFTCTRRPCPQQPQHNGHHPRAARSVQDETCEPNTHFYEYCNVCKCSKKGEKFCTDMLCDMDMLNKDGSLKAPFNRLINAA